MSRSLKSALLGFHERGEFTEDEYRTLRAALIPASPHSDSQTFTGLVGVFFERHLMNDKRRTELLALDEAALDRAVRHRFRQLVADQGDGHRAFHALSPHVREALDAMQVAPSSGASFPASIVSKNGFSGVAVEQAVSALWAEWRRKPGAAEATAELLCRYLTQAPADETTESREFPAVMRAQLDAQRLARGILSVFSPEERDLLRAVLDGVSVDAWAEGAGLSRATAYRLYARLKSLCQLELKDRSVRTQLDAIDVLRGQL